MALAQEIRETIRCRCCDREIAIEEEQVGDEGFELCVDCDRRITASEPYLEDFEIAIDELEDERAREEAD